MSCAAGPLLFRRQYAVSLLQPNHGTIGLHCYGQHIVMGTDSCGGGDERDSSKGRVQSASTQAMDHRRVVDTG